MAHPSPDLLDRLQALAREESAEAHRIDAVSARVRALLGEDMASDRLTASGVLGDGAGPWASRLGRRFPILRWIRDSLESLRRALPVHRARHLAALADHQAAIAELVDLTRELHPDSGLGRCLPTGGAPRTAWVSSWNTRCGLATYSRYLLETWAGLGGEVTVYASRTGARTGLDGVRVRRCWDDFSRPDLAELESQLLANRPEVVVVQFHFGYFRVREFGGFLRRMKAAGVPVVVVLHATAPVDAENLRASLDEITDELAGAARLLVHGEEDVAQLASLGLSDNVELFPHGTAARPIRDMAAAREALGLEGGPWIGTFGFLGPQKGIVEMVEAVGTLVEDRPDLRWLMLHAGQPFPEAELAATAVRAAVARRGLEDHVVLIDHFLPEDSIHHALQAMDLIVFPYQQSRDSASGAVRFGLSSKRPVACTPLPLFAELSDVVHTLPGASPEQLAGGLAALLDDPAQLGSKAAAQAEWLEEHAWTRAGARLLALCRDVLPSTP